MGRSSKEMTLYTKATTAYLLDMEASGVAENTIKNRAYTLNNFYEFMIDSGHSMDGPTTTVVLEWKATLSNNGLAVSTIRQYLVQLRAFFEWASDPEMDEPFYKSSPIPRRAVPADRSASRPYDKLLTQSEVLELLRNDDAEQRNNERNYAIVTILLTTAIRNSELLALTLEDLDFDEGFITIRHGKGDKFRVVQFPAIAQEAVKRYLASDYRPSGLPESAPLFGTFAGENGCVSKCDSWHKGSRSWLSRIVERYVANVTGRENVKSHALRHASSKTLLESGMSMEEIQAILGHSDLQTTKIYTGRLSPKKAGRKANIVYDEMAYQARRLASSAAAHDGALAPLLDGPTLR